MFRHLDSFRSPFELEATANSLDAEDGGTYAARSRAISSLSLSETSGPRDRGSFYEPEGDSFALDSFWDDVEPPLSVR